MPTPDKKLFCPQRLIGLSFFAALATCVSIMFNLSKYEGVIMKHAQLGIQVPNKDKQLAKAEAVAYRGTLDGQELYTYWRQDSYK